MPTTFEFVKFLISLIFECNRNRVRRSYSGHAIDASNLFNLFENLRLCDI